MGDPKPSLTYADALSWFGDRYVQSLLRQIKQAEKLEQELIALVWKYHDKIEQVNRSGGWAVRS